MSSEDLDPRFFDLLNRMMQEALSDAIGGPDVTITPAGTRMKVPPGKNAFHYYSVGNWLFAYTSYPDAKGNYYAWTYKPVGTGARKGKAKRWTSIGIVAFKHKGAAMRRAEKRMAAYASELRGD